MLLLGNGGLALHGSDSFRSLTGQAVATYRSCIGMSVLTKMPNYVRPFAYKQLAWISFFHGAPTFRYSLFRGDRAVSPAVTPVQSAFTYVMQGAALRGAESSASGCDLPLLAPAMLAVRGNLSACLFRSHPDALS